MLARKALIIGAPDEKIPGVNIDIQNLKDYLKSPIGGLWYDNEVKILNSPSEREVLSEISLLNKSDYSLILFAGHGYYSIDKETTVLHINSQEKLDSLNLRVGAKKHTLILDCCRKLERESLMKYRMESMMFSKSQTLTPSACREYFDRYISNCDNGIVVMNSCSIDETAGENESKGGYYTSSLIDCANAWAKNKLRDIPFTKNILPTQACHNSAVEEVKKLSGGRQNPTFESPRTENKFPFAVVA